MVRRKERKRLRRILGWTVMGLLVILLGCSFVLARRHVSVSYTHLTLPTTPYV